MDKKQLIIIGCAVLAIVLIVLAECGLGGQKNNSEDYKKPVTQTTDAVQDATENGDIKFEVDENGNLVAPEQNDNSGNTGNNTGSNTGSNTDSNTGSNTGSNAGSGNTQSTTATGSTESTDATEPAGSTEATDSTQATQPKENKTEFDFSDFFD